MSRVLRVQVVPRSSRDRIDGLHGDALKVRLAAPPVDGAANAALLELLARELGVRRHALRILSGERGRRKRIVLPEEATVPPTWTPALEGAT